MAIAAVALGASVVEKHFTISRDEGGVDNAFSLEPDEFSALVEETAHAWHALGEISYGPTKAESKSLVFRRSIYASADISSGDTLTKENLRIVRPGDGASPVFYPMLLGRTARTAYIRGQPITMSSII